jgi:hypothetical protein
MSAHKCISLFVLLLIIPIAASSAAAIVTYEDWETFVGATGAIPQPPLPNLGLIPGGDQATLTHGDLTFTVAPPATGFYVSEGLGDDHWTSMMSGSQIAINGPEHLNIDIAAPVFAIGFDFVEPGDDAGGYGCGGPCYDTTFEVTLLDGDLVVDSFEFSRADDWPMFVGVSSDEPFDRIEIRDLTGTDDNEYFGRFHAAGVGCWGDLDGDHDVDLADLAALLASYGRCTYGDVDGDRDTDLSDLAWLLTRYQQPCP